MTENHVTEDAIARLAYSKWEAEGRPEGRCDDHWHAARAELEAMVRANKETPQASAKPGPQHGAKDRAGARHVPESA